jgi:integrase
MGFFEFSAVSLAAICALKLLTSVCRFASNCSTAISGYSQLPRSTDKLKVAQLQSAKPRGRPFTLADGGGMTLLVNPDGGKYWRLRYRFGGRAKMLSLGTFPETSLATAREERSRARQLLKHGVDPSAARKAVKASQRDSVTNSFESIAREWYAKHQKSFAADHARTVIGRLESHVFPYIGLRPIAEITPREILDDVLRRIESAGIIETAHRVKTVCGQVFRYAIATGRAERDASADLRGALTPTTPRHLSAVTKPAEVGRLLVMLDGHRGTKVVRAALQLAPLTFVRPGELRSARWEDFDLDAAEWRFVASKTKTPHLVPLSRQAVTVLKELRHVTGRSEYVFPSVRSLRRPMSNNAVLAALRAMGIPKDEMCGHGFRAMARTILDEQLHFSPVWIEHQLAHSVRDTHGRAYNRTAHLEGRRDMMQKWADYLDTLRKSAAGKNVVTGDFCGNRQAVQS